MGRRETSATRERRDHNESALFLEREVQGHGTVVRKHRAPFNRLTDRPEHHPQRSSGWHVYRAMIRMSGARDFEMNGHGWGGAEGEMSRSAGFSPGTL